MRLKELGLSLADVDLGGSDAESDYKLAEHFVTTPYVQSALEGKRTLFLGRKGSGKSALFSQMPALEAAEGRGRIVLQLTPDAYSWSALQRYREQGLFAEHAHANAWKATIGIEVGSAISNLNIDWPDGAARSVAVLTRFIEENFGDVSPGLARTTAGLLKGLGALNLSAFGFGVGLERADATEQELTPAVINALWETLVEPLKHQPVLVELDRLDDSWDGTDDSRTLLIGLLKASKEINDKLGQVEGGIRILIFLRSDIYDGLKFDDKDKHRITEEHILWNEAELREMLAERLPEGVEVEDLFEAEEMRGRIQPFDYILKRTFRRPREILQFIDECLRKAGKDATEISKDAIREAENQYSKWKVEDLKQEFAKVSPEFGALLEALRQELHRYDSIDDAIEVLERKAPDEVAALTPRGAMELLFEASVIGIRLGGGGQTRFKSQDPELTLPTAGAVYVHQSLYRGLNIKEARKPVGEPTEEDVAAEDSGIE